MSDAECGASYGEHQLVLKESGRGNVGRGGARDKLRAT